MEGTQTAEEGRGLLPTRRTGGSSGLRTDFHSMDLGTHVRKGLACLLVPTLYWTVSGRSGSDELNYQSKSLFPLVLRRPASDCRLNVQDSLDLPTVLIC
jgi:hypothetical protein